MIPAMQVLLVDDDLAIRKSLIKGFSREGCSTFECGDGLDAIKIIEKEKVDVIISDVLMPRLDGYGLCHAIKSNKASHSIPVILYSGTLLGDNDKDLAYDAGADCYLQKPLSFDAIFKAATELDANRQTKKKQQHPTVSPDVLLRRLNQMLAHKLSFLRGKSADAPTPHDDELMQTQQKMEALGKLASGVAHDFNNLLSVVLTYSRFIKKNTEATPQILEDVEEIEKAALRSARLTKQLLAFSRKQPFEPQVFNPSSLFKEVEALLRPLIRENILLHTTIEPDVGCVKADPNQLEQIIINLAVNARDAMPNGGKISLELKNHDAQDEKWIVISVQDTGEGIDSDALPRIFEPFFTTKKKDQGTGLGLSIVDRLVQQNGGKITAQSKKHEGTLFKIFIPRLSDHPKN